VIHTYNSSYLEGGGRRMEVQSQPGQMQEILSKRKKKKKQAQGLEFKTQYCQKEKEAIIYFPGVAVGGKVANEGRQWARQTHSRLLMMVVSHVGCPGPSLLGEVA
jgi:hypothetical protein